MERAMRETDRRREKQRAYNEVHGITPTTIKRNIGDIIAHVASKDQVTIALGDDKPDHMVGHNLRAYRSEEHTSELQSLMRISYAVFCLKKKNKNTQKQKTKLTHKLN